MHPDGPGVGVYMQEARLGDGVQLEGAAVWQQHRLPGSHSAGAGHEGVSRAAHGSNGHEVPSGQLQGQLAALHQNHNQWLSLLAIETFVGPGVGTLAGGCNGHKLAGGQLQGQLAPRLDLRDIL